MSAATDREDGLDPVVRLAHELFNDPKTRPAMEAAIAELHPERAEMAVPGHALRKKFEEERTQLQRDRDEWRAERAKDKDDAEAAKMASQWRTGLMQHGARPEEVAPMFDLATKRKIGDPEAVVDQYRKQQRLADPSPGRFGVQMPGAKAGEFFKGLDDNADQWARDRAARDIDAIRNGRPLDPSPIG